MKRILSTCMLAVMTLCFAFQASAIDWVDITLGETYPVGSYQKFYGKYTATETKTLYEQSISYANVYTQEYVDEDTSAPYLLAGRNWTGSYNPYEYQLSVEAGKTYYFVMDYPWQFDAWNFKLYAPVEFGIERIEPKEGSVISQLGAGDGRLYITFTEPPKMISYARLGKTEGFSTTNTGSTKCNATLNGKTVGIDIQSVMLDLYGKGLQPGESLTLALRLQKPDGTYWEGNGNGIHKITFTAAGKPVTKINEKIPSVIYSYMMPEDENGKLVLTFDGDLDPKTSSKQIYFEYGNKESEDETAYGEFPIPFTIDGSVLTLDFTGVSRRRSELLPYHSTPYNTIDVRILNLKDANGNFVNSDGVGTIGSYSYRINYEELPIVNISQEIIPASGTSLKGVNTINWWFDNANNLSFDGVRFDYKDENGESAFVVVPMSEIKNNSLSTSEMDMDITIPAAVKEGSNIIVTLNNLKSFDGVDHSAELTARYDAFTITSITPAAGSSLEKLSRGQVINVKSNFDASHPEMYLTYELIDNNPKDPNEAILLTSYMTREDNGSHSCEIFYDMPLYLGHTYSFRVNYFEDEEASHGKGGYQPEPMAYDEVKWEGLTQPFSFSTYSFESIDPVSGTELASVDNNQFTLKFDGMVMLNAADCKILIGMGMSEEFESLTPVEPTDGYSNTWIATVSKDFLGGVADYLKLSFKAYDMSGKLVEGNEGSESGSYFYFSYPVRFNVPEFACEPADGETVESLSKFTLSFEEGIYPSWIVPEKIQLVSKTGVIHTFDDEAFEYIDDKDETGAEFSKAIILTLPEEVTTDGTYTLMVPDKYFALGKEQLASFSKAQNFNFIVHAPQKAPAYVVTPAEGKVEQLGAMTIEFTECSTITRDAAIAWVFTYNGEPVTNDAGEATVVSIRGTKKMQFAATVGGKTQYLTKNGKYVMTIPAGALTIDGVVYNNDIVMTWTIGDEEPAYAITFNPPYTEPQPHLEYIHMVWDDEDEVGLGMGKATLTKPDGSVVELPDAELDMDMYNKAIQHLGDKHQANGKYVVTFPEGYFTLGSEGNRAEKEVKVEYNVTGISSIGEILNSANGLYTVYNVQGMTILKDATIEEVKTLPAGFYVINGEKFILR